MDRVFVCSSSNGGPWGPLQVYRLGPSGPRVFSCSAGSRAGRPAVPLDLPCQLQNRVGSLVGGTVVPVDLTDMWWCRLPRGLSGGP